HSPAAPSYSTHSPRYDTALLSDDEQRFETERHQKAELKRLRDEVLDIARELTLQRRESGRRDTASAPP
ncbi:hypothetical protein, partial [Acinetobacter baumannii]|uniref:hypothetical protein n=1 Tax=Acinetobacter baumannii TaxID=470 RepID=UPI001489506F